MRWLRRWFNNNVRGAGLARCFHCRDVLMYKPYHLTHYDGPDGAGCFPFCENCFQTVPENLLICGYSDVVHRWRAGGTWVTPEKAERIIRAALLERGLNDKRPIHESMF